MNKSGNLDLPDASPAATLALTRILGIVHDMALTPGGQLPSESDLAEKISVSRGTIREATRALAQLGILTIRNGRRAEVAEFNGNNIAILIDHAVKSSQVSVLQTWDLRQTLETRIARLAALRRSTDQVTKMRGLVVEMRRAADDLSALTRADIALHLALAEAARNPLFLFNIQSMTSVMAWTGPIGYAAIGSSAGIEAHIELHAEIVEAIARQQADEAVSRMIRHFEEARDCMIDSGLN